MPPMPFTSVTTTVPSSVRNPSMRAMWRRPSTPNVSAARRRIPCRTAPSTRIGVWWMTPEPCQVLLLGAVDQAGRRLLHLGGGECRGYPVRAVQHHHRELGPAEELLDEDGSAGGEAKAASTAAASGRLGSTGTTSTPKDDPPVRGLTASRRPWRDVRDRGARGQRGTGRPARPTRSAAHSWRVTDAVGGHRVCRRPPRWRSRPPCRGCGRRASGPLNT